MKGDEFGVVFGPRNAFSASFLDRSMSRRTFQRYARWHASFDGRRAFGRSQCTPGGVLDTVQVSGTITVTTTAHITQKYAVAFYRDSRGGHGAFFYF
jgi:hypothetical protein